MKESFRKRFWRHLLPSVDSSLYYSVTAFQNLPTSPYRIKSRWLDRALGAVRTLAPACCLSLTSPACLCSVPGPSDFVSGSPVDDGLPGCSPLSISVSLPGVPGAFPVSLRLANVHSYVRSQHIGQVGFGRAWQSQVPWEPQWPAEVWRPEGLSLLRNCD